MKSYFIHSEGMNFIKNRFKRNGFFGRGRRTTQLPSYVYTKDITLYTIDCPKCKALEMQLTKKNIEFTTVRDIDVMKQKGFKYAPVLEVNGQAMAFEDAILFVRGGDLS